MRLHQITYTQLSLDIGKSPSYISTSMAKQSLPSMEVVIEIAEYFKVTVGWILLGDQEGMMNPVMSRIAKDQVVVDIASRLINRSDALKKIFLLLIEYEEERDRRAR